MPQRDIYQEVTDKIFQKAQQGVMPWQKPWSGGGYSFGLPKNGTTGAMYRGINILLLECASMEKDYELHEWCSYKQWQEKGQQVRKDEKGTKIIFYKDLVIGEEEDEKKIPLLKDYSVFNACQLEGYKPSEIVQPAPLVERLTHVDEFIENTGAIIVRGGNQNYYRPSTDTIHLVDNDRWIGTADQTPLQAEYNVTFHELGHWTGAKSRLDRDGGKRFGDAKYAAEEGVAEMSAAFVCTALGVQPGPSQNTVSYLGNWLPEVLKDKKGIFAVSSEATKAADYLFMLQNKADIISMPKTASNNNPQPRLAA
ncbi:ArdC family protein [Rufibacter sediminis]|uniref:DUF1738 domain-containing protein n=1 Tax=Rufibacter sediminis TaxID=2762756 RepID=A0ABR6VUP3_9BACT|nr:ArdC-like ssDNA-binding domain-containing protein [Rufibacter sediminis]MBC3540624.1 DUF1738 domain-containing protein [Rufibacter sediminis]